MKLHTLRFEQDLPVPLDQAWEFFSSPANLELITPQKMGFRILSGYQEELTMYPGMIIAYKVTPLLNISVNWVTEITHVKEKEYFIDEQRLGPYAFWHHQHHFQPFNGGVKMTDIVSYAIPYGPLGSLINKMLVRNEILQIFRYREAKVEELFGKFTDTVRQ